MMGEGHSHKILIVDDDPDISKMLKMFLSGKGYAIEVAYNGIEALEKYKTCTPCLIILDINMPEMNGNDVLEALRKDPNFHKVRTIILTASNLLSYKTKFLGSGADDYITKPFQPEEFLARVQAQLRSNELLEAIEKEKDKYVNLSFRDPLTGLYNRRYLQEIFPKIWAISSRENMPLACVMLDIDYFKNLNDTYSHQAGDAVLQGISKAIEKELRRADILARYGGEEFVILMNNTSLEGAYHCTEGIRMRVESTPFSFRDMELKVTLSAGITERQKNEIPSTEELLHSADKALYVAKMGGRNQVRIFNEGK